MNKQTLYIAPTGLVTHASLIAPTLDWPTYEQYHAVLTNNRQVISQLTDEQVLILSQYHTVARAEVCRQYFSSPIPSLGIAVTFKNDQSEIHCYDSSTHLGSIVVRSVHPVYGPTYSFVPSAGQPYISSAQLAIIAAKLKSLHITK